MPPGQRALGATLWLKRYNGPGNGDDYGGDVAVSPDGTRVFVTGSSPGADSKSDYGTLAYDASTGATLWLKRYNGPRNGGDDPGAVAVTPDGTTVFVTGGSAGSTSGHDYATIAYDASTGSRKWTARYNGPGNGYDRAGPLAVSPDETMVFVTGKSYGSASGFDYATIAYDASTGAKLWLKRYNGPGNGYDRAGPVAVSPDGTMVFVTGESYGGSSSRLDYATIAYDASTGTKLWLKRYNGPRNARDTAYSLAVSRDGTTVFVTGTSWGSEFATVAYDALTGATLWTGRYRGVVAFSLAVSPDGARVFVTGGIGGSTGALDYLTIAYDASTGAKLWTTQYNGPGNAFDDSFAVAVSPEGEKVYVTGLSTGSSSQENYLTIAHDASTGAKLWLRRYDGPGTGDNAFSLAVSPDGEAVYVTGFSGGSTSGVDYATIAYSTS